jgi:hypothetical protein
MRMPLISRLLFTLSAIRLTVGAHVADMNPTHIFNGRWPPHAKFRTGQTLSMSLLLALLTIFFAWRKTSDQREAVLATAGFAATYWVTQATAISYPIDDIGTPLGVQQRLTRHADIKTTMNTYGSAFEKTKRRANSRVADLVLPPAIKKQLKDRAKEVSLKNLRPETTAIQ